MLAVVKERGHQVKLDFMNEDFFFQLVEYGVWQLYKTPHQSYHIWCIHNYLYPNPCLTELSALYTTWVSVGKQGVWWKPQYVGRGGQRRMIFCPATWLPDETAQMIYRQWNGGGRVGWMASVHGAVFSLDPADTAKIGLLTKCKRSVSD